ncbi:MAG: phenylalanine--tRNA ligase subunit alpha [Acholeplasmataceae bacterium]
MKDRIETIIKDLKTKLKDSFEIEELEDLRVKYLGKSGEITKLMPLLRNLSNDEKPAMGRLINETKTTIELLIKDKKDSYLAKLLKDKLAKETIDITAPSYKLNKGTIHPLNLVIMDLEDFFIGQGYHVASGPELELDYYNFEMMNLDSNHPARNMHDSFYVTEHELLRTHTSPVQSRYMQKHKNKEIAIIAPGKTYRRDPDDATHSHQFMQCEGLVIGKNINFSHLKDTLLNMAKHLFGDDHEIRLRPSYFPFTEPSVEVDVSFKDKNGNLSYIEVLGAGMVHPNVLTMNGFDPNIYRGFAFGIGIERIAILKYNIDDIRQFYLNDIRFLNQFKGEF